MLAGMSASMFQEWMEYNSIEPFGEYRNELRHGQMMAFQHNIKRNIELKPEPFTVLEFMNFVDKPKEPELPEICDYARIDKEVFGI